ncbi:hypothetical protein [Planomicrobium sp. YIM 101495]|uniref:hypothetical protein n=1 Tax=Planomicrobium sp. YIM 101495 TaxID=2665160 RepID=UPI0018AB2EBC|nr:hypothetical protein [Planomicrobium sp. YIM 101495]
MPKSAHYIIIILCIILTVFLYNQAFGAVPFLILSFYLFYFGWTQIRSRKKNSR